MVTEKAHIGRKIQRIREMKGIKQGVLASQLGLTRQAVSKMENSEIVEEDKLLEVAKALDMTPDAIKNFNEEAVINNISCNFSDNDINTLYQYQQNEKLMELIEENKNLYERMLETERSKIKLLEDQLKSLKK